MRRSSYRAPRHGRRPLGRPVRSRAGAAGSSMEAWREHIYRETRAVRRSSVLRRRWGRLGGVCARCLVGRAVEVDEPLSPWIWAEAFEAQHIEGRAPMVRAPSSKVFFEALCQVGGFLLTNFGHGENFFGIEGCIGCGARLYYSSRATRTPKLRAFSSGGERFPDTEEVTSSNLVTPTKSSRPVGSTSGSFFFDYSLGASLSSSAPKSRTCAFACPATVGSNSASRIDRPRRKGSVATFWRRFPSTTRDGARYASR